MLIRCFILIVLSFSITQGTSNKLHLEFSKDEQQTHRYSIETLEPELASTIFSNLAINPQARTTVRPLIKKIKKLPKQSSEINFLVRVKKDTKVDIMSPDYTNINNDFLNSDDIMFSHDESSNDEMKQVKSFDKNFLHPSIDENNKQQVFVDNKSSIIKGDGKNDDIETVTIMLPSQDIQLDKEDKNWRKMTKGDYSNSNSHEKILKEIGERENNEEEILKDENSDTKNVDDFFNSFDAFSDDTDISNRDKRDIMNTKKVSDYKIKRKIRLGYIKIEKGSNTFEKNNLNMDNNTITPLNNNKNFLGSNEDVTDYADGNQQNTTGIIKVSKSKEDNETDKDIHLDDSMMTNLKSKISNETLSEDKKLNITLFNDEEVETVDFLNKNDTLNSNNDTLINDDSLKSDVINDSSMSAKINPQKNEVIKTYWNIYFKNGTTRKEMITEKMEIETSTSSNNGEKAISNISTLISPTNTTNNDENNKNSTLISLPFNGIENLVTFPLNSLSQDDPIDSNSVYTDDEIVNHEKPLKYKNYSMDLSTTTKKEKMTVATERSIIRKVHDFRSHFLRPF